jgi:hypothetical protein
MYKKTETFRHQKIRKTKKLNILLCLTAAINNLFISLPIKEKQVLKIYFFSDVPLLHPASTFWTFELTQCVGMKMQALRYFETSVTTLLTTQYHFPEDVINNNTSGITWNLAYWWMSASSHLTPRAVSILPTQCNCDSHQQKTIIIQTTGSVVEKFRVFVCV